MTLPLFNAVDPNVVVPPVPKPNPPAPIIGLSAEDVQKQIDAALAVQKQTLEAEALKQRELEKAEVDGKYKDLWEASQKELTEQKLAIARQEACLEAGLPATWVSRLAGKDKSEFVADAKRIKADINNAAKLISDGKSLTPLPVPNPTTPKKDDVKDAFRQQASASFR